MKQYNWQYNTSNIKWWNDEMEDIIKIVKSLEDSGLLLERVSKAIQNDAQKGRFLSMLLGTLDTS